MTVSLTKLPITQQLATKALLESGASVRKAAKLSGLALDTVRAIRDCKTLDPDRVARIKEGMAGKLYDTANRSIDSITDDKLAKSTAVQAMTTAAIAIDKARLIEGKATARTEYVDATDQQINDEIARLEGELAGWKDGTLVNGQGVEEESTSPIGQPAVETVADGGNGAV